MTFKELAKRYGNTHYSNSTKHKISIDFCNNTFRKKPITGCYMSWLVFYRYGKNFGQHKISSFNK
jgi:hypothetical protein